MCDQDAFDAMTEYQLKSGALSRRQLVLWPSALACSPLPAVAAALKHRAE